MEKEHEKLITQLDEKRNKTKRGNYHSKITRMKNAEILSLRHGDLKQQFVKIRTTFELLLEDVQSKKNKIE